MTQSSWLKGTILVIMLVLAALSVFLYLFLFRFDPYAVKTAEPPLPKIDEEKLRQIYPGE